MNITNQIKDFISHLRLHYQIFILSGPYLLGVLLSQNLSIIQLLQFFSVHILLFGGVTAYNSYFDKDEGPIGGLKNPPMMSRWMLGASWVLQVIGLVVALLSGVIFVTSYVLCMLAFWMYSSPHVRLKGKPIGSLIIVATGSVILSSFLGYSASLISTFPDLALLFVGAVSSAFLVISMYPLSQAYQVAEDNRRGDITFAVRFGKNGIQKIFIIFFPLGLALLSCVLFLISPVFGSVFGIFGIVAGFITYQNIKKLTMTIQDYSMIMRVKYLGGLAFAVLMLIFIYLANS